MIINEQQIAKYLAGECSEEEVAQLNTWRHASPENQKTFDLYNGLWSEAKSTDEIDVDVEEALNTFHQTIIEPSAQSNANQRWIRYTAMVTLAIAAGLLFYFYSPSLIEHTNITASPRLITLPDSTKVWLNRQTTLRYPSEFGEEERVVELSGEAYFDVEQMPGHPFLVRSEGTVVKVLGTEFNLTAHPSSNQVSIYLLEGNVSFYSEADPNAYTTLHPLQEGVFKKKTRKFSKRNEDDLNRIAWKTHTLRYQQERLKNVVRDLSAYHHIDIHLDKGLEDCTISTVFDHLSLEETLEVLELTLGVEATVSAGGVLMSGSCQQ